MSTALGAVENCKNNILSGDKIMIKIELNDYSIEDILNEIGELLEEAIKNNSKKRKNEIICQALGKISTLNYMIDITEVDEDIN